MANNGSTTKTTPGTSAFELMLHAPYTRPSGRPPIRQPRLDSVQQTLPHAVWRLPPRVNKEADALHLCPTSLKPSHSPSSRLFCLLKSREYCVWRAQVGVGCSGLLKRDKLKQQDFVIFHLLTYVVHYFPACHGWSCCCCCCCRWCLFLHMNRTQDLN